MGFVFFESLFSTIDSIVDAYILNTSTDVINFISPIFISVMTIWIAIWGYMMWFGRIQEPLQDSFLRILKVSIIITLGLRTGYYSGVIVDFLGHGPETIANIVAGAPSNSSASVLDTLFSKVYDIALKAWEKAGFVNGNFGLYILCVGLLLFGGGLTLVIGFLLLASKLVTAILLAVGPIFITLLLFNSTQRFFEAWLGMVINFGLILILASGLGMLVLSIANYYIDASLGSGTVGNLGNVAVVCLMFAFCILTMKQIPNIASALGGGVALAAQGAISNALNTMRPSTVRNQWRRVKHDAHLAGRVASAPYRGSRAAMQAMANRKPAYQRRWGDNSIGKG